MVASAPTPSSPAIWNESGLVQVCQSGGCGFCSGFGTTSRSGIESSSLSHLKECSVHMRGSMSSASRSCAREVSGSTPKAVHSVPPERARPTSMRPPVTRSAKAARSATRSGWLILNGARIPEWPKRSRFVCRPSTTGMNSGVEL